MDVALQVLVRYGYLVVFAGVFAEQIGAPLPSEPILLAAGALVGTARLNLVLVLGLATLASLVGDTVWYWIGRVGGARVLGWLCRISLEPDSCVRRTERVFATQGARSLLVAKFIPGFSIVAPPLAGVVRMPFLPFLVFTGLGGLIWATAFVGLGWAFSEQLEMAAEYAVHFGTWTVGLAVVAFVIYVAAKFITRQRFLRRIRIARISPEDLKARLDDGEDLMIVDVRDRIDFAAEPSIIPGALHLSIEDLEARHREIPRDRDIVLYCT
jgi:membrane protein DedA with SNARE-associated domain